MNRLVRAYKTLRLRLGMARLLAIDAPKREWPQLAWRLMKDGLTLEDVQGFFERHRSRTWAAHPDVADDVSAFVVLTTRNWERFAVGLYVNLRLVYDKLVDEGNRETLQEELRQALVGVTEPDAQVGIGLTPLISLEQG